MRNSDRIKQFSIEQLFNPSHFSTRQNPEKEHIDFIEQASKVSLMEIPAMINISYGEGPKEKLDIVGHDLPDDAHILVFFHGGFWHNERYNRTSYNFIARHFNAAGVKVIFVGHPVIPEVARVYDIVKIIEIAGKYIMDYALEKGSKGVHFAGYDSGAHLVFCLFASFVEDLITEEQKHLVKTAFCISGIYMLKQLVEHSVNAKLKLTISDAVDVSPGTLPITQGYGTHFLFVCGENESPEFIGQGVFCSEKLLDCNYKTNYYEVLNEDHYSVMETFVYAEAPLFVKMLQKIFLNDEEREKLQPHQQHRVRTRRQSDVERQEAVERRLQEAIDRQAALQAAEAEREAAEAERQAAEEAAAEAEARAYSI